LEKEIGNDTSDEVRRTEACKNFAEELFRHIENYKKVLAGKEKTVRYSVPVLRTAFSLFLHSQKAYDQHQKSSTWIQPSLRRMQQLKKEM
jgi:hypothetical protein